MGKDVVVGWDQKPVPMIFFQSEFQQVFILSEQSAEIHGSEWGTFWY